VAKVSAVPYPYGVLLLKKHLVRLVREGKKRQTLRFWSRPVVAEGQISFTPGLGKMLITKVEVVQNLDELTDADAQADGFSNLAELLAELRRIYPSLPPAGKKLYRIAFEWPWRGTPSPDGPRDFRPRSTRRAGTKAQQPESDTPPHRHARIDRAGKPAAARNPVSASAGHRRRSDIRDAQRAPTASEMVRLRDWILDRGRSL
jgi:hypothetical protein